MSIANVLLDKYAPHKQRFLGSQLNETIGGTKLFL